VEYEGGVKMMKGNVNVLREIRNAMRVNNRQLDCLNNLLGRLVKLKAKEVYGGGLELDNLEIGEKKVRKVKQDLAEIAVEETK